MNMELGGVSTWTKNSSGGPPAPGQTDDVEAADDLGRLGSSEDQQLAGPGFTMRWAGVESSEDTRHFYALVGRQTLWPCTSAKQLYLGACSDEQGESPHFGKSKFLAREEDPVTDGKAASTAAAGSSRRTADWDNISLESPK
jgi:hypothetical protein